MKRIEWNPKHTLYKPIHQFLYLFEISLAFIKHKFDNILWDENLILKNKIIKLIANFNIFFIKILNIEILFKVLKRNPIILRYSLIIEFQYIFLYIFL